MAITALRVAGGGGGGGAQADRNTVIMRLELEPRAGKEQSCKSSLLKEYSGGKRYKLT